MPRGAENNAASSRPEQDIRCGVLPREGQEMSKITIDRAVVEQVLDMFERGRFANKDVDELEALCDVLHAALKQPQVVEQEPVAVINGYSYYGGHPTVEVTKPATTLPLGMPLYAHPQPPRQPLTDDEIEKLFPYTHAWLYEIGLEEATKFARSIEAAHGIGGEA